MEQQINLLRPHFLPKKIGLSGKKILLLSAGLLLILAGVNWNEREQLAAQKTSLAALLKQQNQLLQKIALVTPKNNSDPSRSQAETLLTRQIEAKQAVLAAELSTPHKPALFFSQTLKKIADAKVPGMWLNSVEFNNRENRWLLAGKTDRSKTGLIPQYIDRLQEQFKNTNRTFVLQFIGKAVQPDSIPESNTVLKSTTSHVAFHILSRTGGGL